MEYFVYITNECNLNCKYCSVLLDYKTNNLPTSPSYSLWQLRDFISATQNKYDDKEAFIYFFGGEPTLDYDYIAEFMDFFGNCIGDVAVKYVLHTNGLLLQKLPQRVAGSLSAIMHSINFEVIPRHHLQNSYFSKMIQAVHSLRRASRAIAIGRLTITENTSLYTGVMQLAHFYDLLYWQIINCDKFDDYKSFCRTYIYEVELLFNYWLDYFKQGTFINLVPFVAIVKFMLNHDRDDGKFSCGYGESMVYIQTDGSCYACSDSVASQIHCIGDIHRGVTLSQPSLFDLKCGNCGYRRLCMGRCGRMHKEYSSQHVSEYCALNRYTFNLFLKAEPEIIKAYQKYPPFQQYLNNPALNYTEYTP